MRGLVTAFPLVRLGLPLSAIGRQLELATQSDRGFPTGALSPTLHNRQIFPFPGVSPRLYFIGRLTLRLGGWSDFLPDCPEKRRHFTRDRGHCDGLELPSHDELA